MPKQPFDITHSDKLMFPAVGYTKGQVIEYYRAVAPFILPHLKNRPLTLKMYPNGVTGKHIYLKDAPSHTPTWVKTFAIERKSSPAAIRKLTSSWSTTWRRCSGRRI